MLRWPSEREVNSRSSIDFGPVRFGAPRRMLRWPSRSARSTRARRLISAPCASALRAECSDGPREREVNSRSSIDFGPVRFGAPRRMLRWPEQREVNSRCSIHPCPSALRRRRIGAGAEQHGEVAAGSFRVGIQAQRGAVLALGETALAETEVGAAEIVVGVGVVGIERDGGEILRARGSEVVAAEVEVAEVAVGRRRVGGDGDRGRRARARLRRCGRAAGARARARSARRRDAGSTPAHDRRPRAPR